MFFRFHSQSLLSIWLPSWALDCAAIQLINHQANVNRMIVFLPGCWLSVNETTPTSANHTVLKFYFYEIFLLLGTVIYQYWNYNVLKIVKTSAHTHAQVNHNRDSISRMFWIFRFENPKLKCCSRAEKNGCLGFLDHLALISNIPTNRTSKMHDNNNNNHKRQTRTFKYIINNGPN